MCFWDCRTCRKRKRRARTMEAVRTEQNFRQATLYVETIKQRLALIRLVATTLATVFFALAGWVWVTYWEGDAEIGCWYLFLPYWVMFAALIFLTAVVVRHCFLTREMPCPPVLAADEDRSGSP